MGRRGRLAGPAFEIHNADDLKVLVAATMGQVPPIAFGTLIEMDPQGRDILDRVGAAAVGGDLRLRTLPLKTEAPEIAGIDPDDVRNFPGGEPPQRLLGRWRKQFQSVSL